MRDHFVELSLGVVEICTPLHNVSEEYTHLHTQLWWTVQALFVPTVLAGYASMVTHHILDSALLVQHGQEHQLPAQVSSPSAMPATC